MSLKQLLSSAAFRFALIYAAVFAVFAMIVTALIFIGLSWGLERQMRGPVHSELERLVKRVAAEGDRVIPTLVAKLDSAPYIYAYFDREGRPLAGHRLALPDLHAGWLRFEAPLPGEGDSASFLGRAARLANGDLLLVARDVDDLDDVQDLVLTTSAWTIGVMLILAVLGGGLMSGFTLRRIDAVAATTARIITGDLSHRVPLSGSGDEFDRLALQINAMLDRIVELMAGMREITNDIAHDLRTPLGRLRNHLEAMAASQASPEELPEALAYAIGQTDAILKTFTALLRIAEIETGSRRAGFRKLDLSTLACDLAESFIPVAEDLGRRLSAEIAPGIEVVGDPELLAQMIVNIIENGLRHTPPGASVRVELIRRADDTVLTVSDDGPGIPAVDRARALQRFVRLEASRSTPGSGLGMSLVAAVAQLHDVELTLEDNEPGLRIVLRFPPLSR